MENHRDKRDVSIGIFREKLMGWREDSIVMSVKAIEMKN